MSDEKIVKQCLEKLLTRQFGWIKFNENKNCIACPGFVYPPDEDGISRAQKVVSNGPLYITDTKYIYRHYYENIADTEKDALQVSALKKFNKKFKTSFV